MGDTDRVVALLGETRVVEDEDGLWFVAASAELIPVDPKQLLVVPLALAEPMPRGLDRILAHTLRQPQNALYKRLNTLAVTVLEQPNEEHIRPVQVALTPQSRRKQVSILL